MLEVESATICSGSYRPYGMCEFLRYHAFERIDRALSLPLACIRETSQPTQSVCRPANRRFITSNVSRVRYTRTRRSVNSQEQRRRVTYDRLHLAPRGLVERFDIDARSDQPPTWLWIYDGVDVNSSLENSCNVSSHICSFRSSSKDRSCS